MLSPTELAELRAIEKEAMPDTFRLAVIAEAETELGFTAPGSVTAQPPAMLDPYRGRIEPLPADREGEQLVNEKLTAKYDSLLVYEYGALVEPQKQAIVNGVAYDILHVDPLGQWATAGTAIIRRSR